MPHVTSPLLLIALVLLAGLLIGALARRIGLPSLTGQILAGIPIGPPMLGIIDEGAGESLQPMIHFALGLVAVMIGSHLGLRKLRNARKRLLILVALESTITPALVWAGLSGAGAPLALGWLLAALAVSTAPASIVALVKETRARGVFVKTLIAAVALNNIACILIFEAAHEATRAAMDPGSGHDALSVVIAPLRQLLFAALLGSLAGLALVRATRNVVDPDHLATASLLAILFTAGLADHWGLSPLLCCMFLGIALANLTPEKDGIGHRVFEDLEAAIFAVFFTVAGAQLHLESLWRGGPLAAVLFATRLCGKCLASHLAMRLAGATEGIRRWLGPALTPQAGVAVGLLLLLGDEPHLADHYELLLAVGLSVVTLKEILGPVLTRAALRRSGDAGKDRARLIDFLHEENIAVGFRAETEREAIEKMVELLLASNHLPIDRESFLASVLERERQLSTFVGGGLWIPHGVLPEGERIAGAMAISEQGLDFDATPDGEPIHCIVLLGTPPNQRDRHLEVLAALARAIGTRPQVHRQLFSARSPAHVHDLLRAEESADFNRYLDE